MMAPLLLLALLAAGPQRVVSLAPSITEIVFALGAGDRLVGVSSYCDYPPAALTIDRIGTFLQPNVERILAKRPDLVLGVPSPDNRAPVERMEALGLHVLIVNPERIAETYDAIRTIATALGVPERGEALVAELQAEVGAITARLDDAPRPRVLLLVGRAPLIAAGTGTYQDELITLARGENLAAGSGAWPMLNLESIVRRAPEVIIDASMGNEESPDRSGALGFWKPYETIPAVRDGRIYGYRAYELLRPGPRLPETLAMLARYLHPERFPAPGATSGQ